MLIFCDSVISVPISRRISSMRSFMLVIILRSWFSPS